MESILSKLNKIKRYFLEFFKVNPNKHWVFLLYTFFGMILILILFSFYLLYEIKNDQIFQVKLEIKEKKNLLKEDSLNRITNLFDQKNQRTLELNSGASLYKDPSI